MRAAIKEAALSPAQVSGMAGMQSFCFDQNFIGFSGHFPGYPIFPAVLQVLLAQQLAEQVLGVPLVVISLLRAKFLQQLRPGDEIEVHLNCQEKDGAFRCSAELQVGGLLAANFTLVLDRGSAP